MQEGRAGGKRAKHPMKMTESHSSFAFGHFQQAVRDIPPGILFLSVVGLRSMLALVMLFQDIGRQCCCRIDLQCLPCHFCDLL